jgi:hypothetical protein
MNSVYQSKALWEDILYFAFILSLHIPNVFLNRGIRYGQYQHIPSINGLETKQSTASFILEQVLISSIILKIVVSHLTFVISCLPK